MWPREVCDVRKQGSQNTHQSLHALRSLENSVLQLAVDSKRDLRCVMRKLKLLYKMLLRKSVPLNLREPVPMSPNLCPNWSPLRSVWMFPKRFAPDQELTQEK